MALTGLHSHVRIAHNTFARCRQCILGVPRTAYSVRDSAATSSTLTSSYSAACLGEIALVIERVLAHRRCRDAGRGRRPKIPSCAPGFAAYPLVPGIRGGYIAWTANERPRGGAVRLAQELAEEARCVGKWPTISLGISGYPLRRPILDPRPRLCMLRNA